MTEPSRPLAGKTVAFDYDGPVHSYTSGWTGEVPIDPPTPGAREAIAWCIEQGAEVVIFTTRALTEAGRIATEAWLAEHEFPPLRVTHTKPPAVAYVDDRAVPYRPGVTNWADVRADVLALAHPHPRKAAT